MKLIKRLIFFLKTKPFHKLKNHDTFNIIDDLGKAGFQKTGCISALCLDSENGTYEIGKEYAIEMHERVCKTCGNKRNRDYLLILMFYAFCFFMLVLFYLYIFK